MNVITEKDYPVRGVWVMKSIIGSIFILLAIIPPVIIGLSNEPNLQNDYFLIYLFPIVAVIILLFLLIFSIFPLLQRATFHYALEDKFIVLKQGIIAKEQRHIPYDVIQDVLVRQDLLDRLLGINSLVIENAAQGGNDPASYQAHYGSRGRRRYEGESIGFSGNKVYIPGLTSKDVEALKDIVLRKALENPGHGSQSGL